MMKASTSCFRSSRNIAGALARDRDLLTRSARHQGAVVCQRDEAEAHFYHAGRVSAGRVVYAGKLSAPPRRFDQFFVDREYLGLFAIEHRLHAERKPKIARTDVDAADARHVKDRIDVVDG